MGFPLMTAQLNRVPRRMSCQMSMRFLACALALLGGCAAPRGPGAAFRTGPCGQPRVPAAGVDRLRPALDLELEGFALGKDAVSLEGDAVLQRGAPAAAQPSAVEGDLLSASIRGDSKVFGAVLVTESPTQRSP